MTEAILTEQQPQDSSSAPAQTKEKEIAGLILIKAFKIAPADIVPGRASIIAF